MNDIFNGAKPLGFGLMRLPLTNPNDGGSIDFELTKKMVDMYMERGFTYFDTALMYCNGKSEAAVKEVLSSRYPRESYTLATKLHAGFIQTEEDRDIRFYKQLSDTGVDYFDYYLVHDVNAHSIEVYDKLHVWDWVQQKKAEGKMKHIGFSFHDTPELLEKVITEHPEMEFVQIQLNYLDYENPGVQSRACYEVCRKYDMPIIIMEPVKGGTLVNVGPEITKMYKDYHPDLSVASWAIRFAASHENVKMVLSGMSNLEQLDDNTGYMEHFQPITEEENALITKAVAILNGQITVPCTGCEYCVDGCPMNIAIPKYFALYNNDVREVAEGKDWNPNGEYYENLTKTFGKASECVECGQCEEMCPQHLPIIEHLKAVAKQFEN